MTITLDPGHGQFKNPGVLAGYYEGTRVFMLAYELKKELEKYEDVTVRVTREKLEDDPSLATRGKSAGKNGSTLFIRCTRPPPRTPPRTESPCSAA